MTLNVTKSVRTAQLSRLNTLFANGRLRFYTGGKPATANLVPSGTLLSVIVMPAVPFIVGLNGMLTRNGVWRDPAAAAAGTVGWARMSQTSDDLSATHSFHRADLTVSAPDGGGDIEMLNLDIVVGMVVNVNNVDLH